MRPLTFQPQRHERVVRVLKIGLSVLLGALAVVMVSVLILIPRATGGTALTVLSGSMTPTIPVGSVVIVRPAVVEELSVGDVITFQKSSSAVLTTHRIVEVQSDDGGLSFITKGDANEANDVNPVPADAVRARVWFHVPFVGLLRDAIATPWGLGTILALVALSTVWERITTVVRRRIPMATVDPTSESAPPAPPALAAAAPHAQDERSPAADIPVQEGDVAIEPIPVPVPRIDVRPAAPVEQQLMLARLSAGAFARGKVVELLGMVNGHAVSIGSTHMVVSISGTPEYLDGVEGLLESYGILESRRSQVVHVGGDPDTGAQPIGGRSVNPSALELSPSPPPSLALVHANGTPIERTHQ